MIVLLNIAGVDANLQQGENNAWLRQAYTWSQGKQHIPKVHKHQAQSK